MRRFSTAMMFSAALAFATASAAQSTNAQAHQSQPAAGHQVTLTGCVIQASDNPSVLAFVPAETNKSGESAAAGQSQNQPGQTGAATNQPQTQSQTRTATGTSGSTAATGTTGGSSAASAMNAPFYRLKNTTNKVQPHAGHRVQVTGTITPAKDEKGADIVMSRSENIGVPTTTITVIDLKPAPELTVSSIQQVGGNCPSSNSQGK